MTATPAGSARTIRCPRCALSLDLEIFASGGGAACPACQSRLGAAVFPAFAARDLIVPNSSGERAMDGEAACFFHAEKRASVACELCGRFLCPLCDLPMGARHLCPSCLHSDAVTELIKHRTRWGPLAAFVGVVPLVAGLFIWPFLIMTGPTAIVVACWGWKKPGSLVHGPEHWLAGLGILGGFAQIAGFAGMLFFLWFAMTRA